VSEFLNYINSLRRQVPKVEKIRDEARARGDLTAVRNAESLLARWAVQIATFTPANDLSPPQQQKRSARQALAAAPEGPVPDRYETTKATGLQVATRAMKRHVGSLWLAFRDGRTPWYAKAVAVLACFLAVSPIDFTPDVIPHVGYLDDPAILVLGTALAGRLISPMLIAEFREQAASVHYARAVRGSFAICSIWLAAILVTMLHVWRPVI
jgi:uncharacterized membrane protein YkvA (DUF1232 family)